MMKKIVEILENLRLIAENNRGILKDACKFSDDVMESKYAIAYEHYRKQEFSEGMKNFAYLTLINPMEKKFWIGLASCQMKSNMFSDALNSFSAMSAIDPQDPVPFFNLAYCQLKTGNLEDGAKSVEQAIDIAKEDHKYRDLEDRARNLLQQIKGVLDE